MADMTTNAEVILGAQQEVRRGIRRLVALSRQPGTSSAEAVVHALRDLDRDVLDATRVVVNDSRERVGATA